MYAQLYLNFRKTVKKLANALDFSETLRFLDSEN